MAAVEKLFCEKCQRQVPVRNFYNLPDGTHPTMCKKCLTMHVDPWKPDTFMWLFPKFDVPYIPIVWERICNKAYAANPKKVTGTAVFGRYLATMKLAQWSKYGWADTEKLQAEAAEKANPVDTEENEELRQKYINGEISESEYKTLMPDSLQYQDNAVVWAGGSTDLPTPEQQEAESQNVKAKQYLNIEVPDVTETLSEEDKVYLTLRWGANYTPAEWLSLEKFADDMKQSFEITDADSETVLLLLSKLNLKMNQAIDSGDYDGFKKLSSTFDSLRKSAKFTAAQNKEKKEDVLSSVGELIDFCEKKGFIPRQATDIAQDKVDMTLQDITKYLNNLVRNELGFGAQIETALKKIQLQSELESETHTEEEELTDEEMQDFFKDIEKQRQEDEENLYEDERVVNNGS